MLCSSKALKHHGKTFLKLGKISSSGLKSDVGSFGLLSDD